MVHQCYKSKKELLVCLSRGLQKPKNSLYHPHLAPTQHIFIESESGQFLESEWSHQFLEATFPTDHITQGYHANLYFLLMTGDRIFVLVYLFTGLLLPCSSIDTSMRTQRYKDRVWSPLRIHHLGGCSIDPEMHSTSGQVSHGQNDLEKAQSGEWAPLGGPHSCGPWLLDSNHSANTNMILHQISESLPPSSTKPKVKCNLWSCEY